MILLYIRSTLHCTAEKEVGMHNVRKSWIILGVLVLTAGLGASEKPLASQGLQAALKSEVSGERALLYTVQISQYDRIQASQGWHAAAEMIKNELQNHGYTDAAIEGWPSNGSRYYYTYQTPIGWRAKKGELWLLSPQQEKLCSYSEIPLTLVKHSNSADVEAELIDVGTGLGEESYQGRNVKGKIVLATAYTGDVMREAVVQRGALGVITWYPPEVRPGYPEMIRYTAIWPRWEEREDIGFGFNVSKQQGWQLKKYLEDGQIVRLKAQVEAEYYDSQIEILTASLPGNVEPEKEVLIVGHLCHPAPSANDNASGSGGMLEMARALRTLIDQGKINPPRRTIRFLWVPEFYGTVPYIQAHLERTRNTLSVINCDMIGEDLHLTGGTFNITCTPDSMPSYLNDVVVNFTRLIEGMNLRSPSGSQHPFAYRILPYSGGSDHLIFNDGALKVPAVMFGHGDTFHHTSLDTPDKVDASELRRVCGIALGVSYYLADAKDLEALEMARLISRNGLARAAQDSSDSLNPMIAAKSGDDLYQAYKQARNIIAHAWQREKTAVLSAGVFASESGTQKDILQSVSNLDAVRKVMEADSERLYKQLSREKGVDPKSVTPTAEENRLGRIIPIRAPDFVCPLQSGYIVDKLGEDAAAKMGLGGNNAYEALNFVDGVRSITEIAQAVNAEYGPIPLNSFYEYFMILEQAELIRFDQK